MFHVPCVNEMHKIYRKEQQMYLNHFYFLTNALNYTKLKRLKSTLYKSSEDKKLKITPICFRSYVIHHQGVQSCAWLKLLVVIHRYFVVCLVGVWQRNFEPVVCVYGPAGRTVHTHTTVISVKHSSVLPDDGSHKIRNMSEWFLIFLIFCLLSFYTT